MKFKLFRPREMEEWAAKHKYLLTFLSFMFVVTWGVELLINYVLR
jgi:hypothetical protein